MKIEERSGYNEERWMGGEGDSIPSFDLPIPLHLLGANENGPADGDPININRKYRRREALFPPLNVLLVAGTGSKQQSNNISKGG